MFLSRLFLDTRSRLARRVRSDLARPYELHRTLWNCFPNLQSDSGTKCFLNRILFRLDAEENYPEPILLVQSGIVPDWSKLPSNYTLSEPECKTIELSFRAGQLLRFRLRANPTKKLQVHTAAGDRKKNGKRVALLTEEEQIAWLVRQGERHEITDRNRQQDPVFAGGFRLHQVKPSLERTVTVYSCDVAGARLGARPQEGEGHKHCP